MKQRPRKQHSMLPDRADCRTVCGRTEFQGRFFCDDITCLACARILGQRAIKRALQESLRRSRPEIPQETLEEKSV